MKRIIQWFIDNPIAANLLMLVIIIGGLSNLVNLNKEVFPGVETNLILVSVPYPGAGPAEVEEQVVKRIEEAIADLDGIREMTSIARLSLGTVQVETVNGYDSQRLLNNIKGRVDAISTFPVDAEKPTITEVEWQSEVMNIGLYGDVDERLLKATGEKLRDEIALLPGVSVVNLNATRPDEMAIEISEYNLQRYNLSFNQVAAAVSRNSLNLPAGVIRSDNGDLQLQTRGQGYNAGDFEQIVVDSRADGAQLTLGDVATITDGFSEDNVSARLNGKPVVFIEVKSTDNPDVLKIADTVHAYLQQVHTQLPPGIEFSVWQDWSVLFESRMDLLLENSASGLLLVFIILMLFLRPALAGWVCVGIAVAFLGALWLLPLLGVSLNMVSMFAFLMVLGIVVDDAIIIGESVYSQQQQGLRGKTAAIIGTQAVSKPVLYAVISTMIFFVPLLVIPGTMGDMSYSIPVVVILALTFSLIESFCILPSHLAHLKANTDSRWRHPLLIRLERNREALAATLERFADRVYRPLLLKSLSANSTSIALFAVVFALSVALYNGGWLVKTFMPVVPSDFVRIQVTVPEGSPFTIQQEILQQLEQGAEQLKSDAQLFHGDHDGVIGNIQSWAWDNNALVTIALNRSAQHDVAANDIAQRWRQRVGDIPDAEQVKENATINEISSAISLRLSLGTEDPQQVRAAIDDIKQQLAAYPGIYDLRDSLTAARTEIELNLKPDAQMLGLTLADIAQQVRQGFYGEEAQRIPRGKEDVRVMVRYPKAERHNVDHLREMRIRTADGSEVPLDTVASVRFVPGFTQIERIDRKRAINITAEVVKGEGVPAVIVAGLLRDNLERWQQQYPDFQLSISGDMEDESEFFESAVRNFVLAVLVIYALMAVSFRSYWQPLLILTAIPFGFMGAVIGHLIMGREVSMMSILGFFACAGVVVNDNLVLLGRINSLREEGKEVFAAVAQAGRDRFRPIILTSVTTFIGLMPIMAETSSQARFLIPMVISLSFGVMFATTVTLFLVPNLFLLAGKIPAGRTRQQEDHSVMDAE